ncbi:DUF2332 domain-containing protein [Halorussus gelatinilyticus]|uniref:DUF2332 domain-containing protein n=1 Tax=Halorussus gelatinilyticus TaxID=2937524 RepID=A0A8U0IIU5_9EURY|nr:DUF2332 domain-containing protein [Halorussus gelatinilyticus]UPW00615.1 DUF2332 domain-containing protein [Halorussus gelatinilyticus]
MNRDDLSGHFEWFADWCVGTSPLYERLARGVAADPDLLDLASAPPDDRSPAHLLFAAVQFLLLSGNESSLADFYPTVTDHPTDPAERDPVPAFREFCLSNADAIRNLTTTRRTQTNSVRRCAALLPAFEEVSRHASRGCARDAREPLALVEVGPSAGLNLLWDRYGYDYGPGGRYGTLDSPVRVESTVHEGDPPLPENAPPVASRVGVDLNPLDVTDDADARWLRSLVWPEHDDRHRTLRSAIRVAREHPPDLREGDALDLLPTVLAEIPDDRPVCLFDTQVRYQLDEAARDRFDALVAELGADRDLYVVSGDLTASEYEQAIDLTLTTVEGDSKSEDRERAELQTERLGVYQQHGAWITWDE